MKADRAQHADLLPAFDHRPEGNHANGRQTDDETQPHESLEDVEEAPGLRLKVFQLILHRDDLDTIDEQLLLDLLGDVS